MAMRPHHYSARSRRLRHSPIIIILSLFVLAWQPGQPFAIVHGTSLSDVEGADEESRVSRSMMMIPEETLRPFGEYPDLLHLGGDDDDDHHHHHHRQSFHPIVKFPHQCWRQQQNNDDDGNNGKFACAYSDYTVLRPSNTTAQLLEKEKFDRKKYRWPLVPRLRRWWRTYRIPPYDPNKRYVGRYDEDRVGLYETELFGTTTTSDNDNETTITPPQPRTVHVGMDLSLYVGSPVYSFDHGGVVEAVGYNPAHGDYGHVVVVRYETPPKQQQPQQQDHGNNNGTGVVIQYYYVLYGHLDGASSTKRHRVGDVIPKGGIIGWLGDAYENGGWTTPHVHVQISTVRPSTHDLPGAVRRQDRREALQIYLDPRYIVGPLY